MIQRILQLKPWASAFRWMISAPASSLFLPTTAAGSAENRSFVRDILTDPNDAIIARTIVALGDLGTVIAEGWKRNPSSRCWPATAAITTRGFLFGRPMTIDQFERALGIPAD
ncbi:MAG: hypothetical protein R3F38_14270 [Gammaproteobacteria bacterium]